MFSRYIGFFPLPVNLLQAQTKKLEHEVKTKTAPSPLPPIYNVDNQVIFSPFVDKTATFSNID